MSPIFQVPSGLQARPRCRPLHKGLLQTLKVQKGTELVRAQQDQDQGSGLKAPGAREQASCGDMAADCPPREPGGDDVGQP